MTRARVAWAPHPYKAGFCITDDTDAATLEQVRAVYDHLRDNGLRATKTVWAFKPEEPCGIPATPDSTLRGITLEDPEYLAYCRGLSAAGFEIALHGATAGNNRRETVRRAFDFLEKEVGAPDTYICHSKNADNPYWEAKITRLQPFRWLLGRMSRHACSGEIETSPYFWGDVCRARVRQIRLLRTRSLDTLARNPSMPYHDPRKPWVNGWFSATKRPLSACAAPEALARLKRDRGLTVLYQYLHRYAKPEGLDPEFTRAVGNLRDPEIWVDTAAAHMRRLRHIQGVFLAARGRDLWLVNVNADPVENLRIDCPGVGLADAGDLRGFSDADGLVVESVPARSVRRLALTRPVRLSGPRGRKASTRALVRFAVPGGALYVNLGERALPSPLGTVEPGSYRLDCGTSGTGEPLLSRASWREEFRLLVDQGSIILREILFKGRSLDPEKYLNASTSSMPLEDHARW